MGNIHVNLYEFGPVVQKEISFKDISRYLTAPLFSRPKPFVQF